MFNIKPALIICLLAFASIQTLKAEVIYHSIGTIAGTLEAPEGFEILDDFTVESGTTYRATLTDIGTVASPSVDNFDGLSMVIFDEVFSQVGDFLALAPISGSGKASTSFTFTALEDALFFVALGGTTDALSTYVATISALPVSEVPVPAAIWLFGSAIFSLLGFTRYKKT